MNPSRKQSVIFCDFDGTITENDNILAVMKHFNPPGWVEIVNDLVAKKLSIREAVGRIFALLPTANKAEIIRYAVDNVQIRSGFRELLSYCGQHGIHFLVTSGGIDFFVYRVLAPFPIEREQIFCNGSDFSGETIRILWPHPCDEHCLNDCGMCKTKIIRSYPQDQYFRILIGDSLTDFEGAKLADLVFARSHLIDQCKQTGVPYIPYETFLQVINELEKEVEV